MTRTRFDEDLERSLSDLEALTGQLGAADPGELQQLEELLKRRGAALTGTLSLLAGGGRSEDAEAAGRARPRLQAVFEAGEDLSERVRLVQAATRERLREMHRVQFALRAVGAEAEADPGPSMVAVIA